MDNIIQKYSIGDHLSVFRNVYWHHGIYIGEGELIHFEGIPGGGMDLGNAKITKVSLDEFSAGSIPKVVRYEKPRYNATEVVQRAHLRLGEKGYSFITNNCEHFAHWCKTGIHYSEQANKYVMTLVSSSLIFGPLGPLVAGATIDLADRGTYRYECHCGYIVKGLTSVWMCRDCGKRYCSQCISKQPKLGFADRKCSCENKIDGSQKIRQGVVGF